MLVFLSDSREQTFAIGRLLTAIISKDSVIAMQGNLGSGKTCLAKGIAAGLGITENITSPTYTIINEYPLSDGKTVLYHIDAYRLLNDEDFLQIGGPEIINGDGISLIEWSERIQKSLPENAINVRLEITGGCSRKIYIDLQESL